MESTLNFWRSDCESLLAVNNNCTFQRPDPILWYDEVVLFEDELHDHGISLLTAKIRVMPTCFLILLRHWLRVDGIIFYWNKNFVCERLLQVYYCAWPTLECSTSSEVPLSLESSRWVKACSTNFAVFVSCPCCHMLFWYFDSRGAIRILQRSIERQKSLYPTLFWKSLTVRPSRLHH